MEVNLLVLVEMDMNVVILGYKNWLVKEENIVGFYYLECFLLGVGFLMNGEILKG